MIFDYLAGIVETYDRFASLRNILKQCKLFLFEGKPHEVLPNPYTEEQVRFFSERFALPHQFVAIEDEASCCILMDESENVRGLGHIRRFVDCTPLSINDRKGYRETISDPGYERWLRSLPRGTHMINEGWVRIEFSSQSSIRIAGVAEECILVKPNMPLVSVGPNNVAALKNARASIEEIMYFTDHNQLVEESILEGESADTPPSPNEDQARIARSPKRPVSRLVRLAEEREGSSAGGPQMPSRMSPGAAGPDTNTAQSVPEEEARPATRENSETGGGEPSHRRESTASGQRDEYGNQARSKEKIVTAQNLTRQDILEKAQEIMREEFPDIPAEERQRHVLRFMEHVTVLSPSQHGQDACRRSRPPERVDRGSESRNGGAKQ